MDMNKAEITGTITKAIEASRKGGIKYQVLYKQEPETRHAHEFLFFIKPEITLLEDAAKLSAVLHMALEKMDAFGMRITDIRLMTATYLEKYDIIAQHYGVINALSRNPAQFLSTEARDKFKTLFGKTVEEAGVTGSLQFMQQHPGFDAFAVEKLWQSGPSSKLAGGTYCARLEFEGKEMYMINGFHPTQLIHFTSPGRCIVAFTLTGNTAWAEARNAFIGKTNPAEAMPGSLRNELLVRKEAFGLDEVSSSRNGFHLSAGPVEGLVELIRYCSDLSAGTYEKPGNFAFGRQLLSVFPPAEVDRICTNPMVNINNGTVSIFDLTEEKNSDAALALLREALLK